MLVIYTHDNLPNEKKKKNNRKEIISNPKDTNA